MRTRFIRSSEKKRIEVQLNQQFGISKLPYLLLEAGKEKTRAFSGHLSKEEIAVIAHTLNVETIGIYLLKLEQDYRLSLDATHLLKDQITKNVLEITDSDLYSWLRGHDLNIKTELKGTIVIKNSSDFIGCGKSNGEKIFNYIPKDRRIKRN